MAYHFSMDIDTVSRFDLFRNLTDSECTRIVSLGREHVFEAGEPILQEGSRGEDFYLMLSGNAEVTKAGIRVDDAGPGEILGEMSLFNDQVRGYGVTATERTECVKIETSDFLPLVLHNDPAAVKMLEALGRVMTERLQRQDAELVRKAGTSDVRLAQLADSFAPLKKQLMADWALKYHAIGRPGKLAITATKAAGSAADLSVAYSPGVAEPCVAIAKDPGRAYDYTAKGQLVGVVTNGTAVLGLGKIGALAAKPVMEGKAILFKRFADIDSFDIEVNETDPGRFIEVVCAIAPTFGGINLEDIKAPECFEIERECRRRLDIPVFHDDQHGTAIISGAGLLNALEIIGKNVADIRVVFSGAGAAGFSCAKFMLSLGVSPGNLLITDIHGVVHKGRGDDNYLAEIAAETDCRTLADAIEGADVFVGVSAPGVLSAQMLKTMNRDPIVFAMANPVPEIDYPTALRAREDVIMGTGRSDYPNQINNVSAFPYIFRGALDVRATAINEEMKLAAAHAIARLAREPVTEQAGFDGSDLRFGRTYVIPRPFDRRLLIHVSAAVAEAAMQSKVAQRTVDLDQYREQLRGLARLSGTWSQG
jgi:malate dehydrogenase (oxaloacetate-decarboxylating)(NADP+)